MLLVYGTGNEVNLHSTCMHRKKNLPSSVPHCVTFLPAITVTATSKQTDWINLCIAAATLEFFIALQLCRLHICNRAGTKQSLLLFNCIMHLHVSHVFSIVLRISLFMRELLDITVEFARTLHIYKYRKSSRLYGFRYVTGYVERFGVHKPCSHIRVNCICNTAVYSSTSQVCPDLSIIRKFSCYSQAE